MKTYYKVQQHQKFGWEDVGSWVTDYKQAENLALTYDKPKQEHIRILEKRVNSKYSATFSSHFIRGSIKRGIEREVRYD